MEFEELVKARRSMRAYQENATLSVEELKEIICVALEAPSWKNSETGRYYVVSDPEQVKRISKAGLPEFNQNNTKNAVALIVTAFESGRAGFDSEGNPVNELGNEWGAYDLGLQNMLLCLKAKEAGFDSLIMGIRDEKALRRELNIPDSQHVAAVIALGKGAMEMKKPIRKEVDEVAVFISKTSDF